MLINRAYYLLKPLLPWRVRMALRRMRANSRRTSHFGQWPIDPRTGMTPPGWRGWPDGKRFAFVLTHDVEGTRGLSRVERLMAMEQTHGFRSSFNFVPEGEYRLPDSVRRVLGDAGFEVGVHGLEHDGKLYGSKKEFSRKAARIREYAREWRAVGFRSPLMQHKLGWIHELGFEYDASTFDTDPFEPEPDGVGTIFPFWVPGLKGGGFVELPYTLAQDFTLFQVLGERSIDIWKKKLDWVADRGGMVLLNTHPDYMCFGGKAERDEFPIAFYEELLRYVKEKYRGAYWQALPREVSRYYCTSVPKESRASRQRVCMLAYTNYEGDNRVRRYAEALAKRGDHVDVVALSGVHFTAPVEEIRGVRVHRIQNRVANERHKWTYAWRLIRFLLAASIFLYRSHKRVRYDLVHVHNMPDFLVFAAWYPRFSGAKLILDIHDIVPELFANKFRTNSRSLYPWLLLRMEKLSASFVHHVIVSNHLWYDKLIARSVSKDKCSVYINLVDPDIFYRRPRTRTDERLIILFPGSFQWHQGLDLAIEAFALLSEQAPHAEFHIYGGGPMEHSLMELTLKLKMQGRIKFCGGITLEKIADVMANADLGVVPKRADSFGNEAFSTKILEFMSQGVPVIASRTKIDTFYFDDNVVRFFESGDVRALAGAMLEVIQNRNLRESLIRHGHEYVDRNSWSVNKRNYFDLVDSLCTESFGDPPVTPSVVLAPAKDDPSKVSL
jgi:glycosyltransferase involved in cell wall biosynthesis/peptidoglycan/xylan/chitin deacetylase (PgdA/CDA1 family)